MTRRPPNLLRSWMIGVAFGGVFSVLVPVRADESPKVPQGGAAVETVRSIQLQAVEEPFHEHEVRAEGVVTWVDKNDGVNFYYIQDGTAGIQVSFEDGKWPAYGDLVEVSGTLVRSSLAPVISKAAFVALGPSQIPEPAAVLPDSVLNGVLNGEIVRLDAWVRSAKMVSPSTLVAVLYSASGYFTTSIGNAWGMNPDALISSRVRVQGVASPMRVAGAGATPDFLDGLVLAAIKDRTEIPPFIRHLMEIRVLAMSPQNFIIFRKKEADPWSLPITPLSEAFRYHPGQTRGQRIHVRGEAIYWENGVLFLNDGTAGLSVVDADLSGIRRGDWVEAVGFPDMNNFLPVLSFSRILPAKSSGSPVAARELRPEQLQDGLRYAGYVAVTARLLDRMQTASHLGGTADGTLILALQSSRGVFTAEVKNNDAAEGLRKEIEVGSTVNVKGICLFDIDANGRPTAVKILVPSPEQVTVVKPASFFNVKRLLILLSIALAGLSLAILLIYLFARRNITLQAEMRERRAVTAERNRLARDLHDTMEQGLTGIHLQLHSIGPFHDDASSKTQERLEAVRSLVQQCHLEMRNSIWNLRSTTLEHFDLAEALERTARSLVLGSSIQVELRQQRSIAKIPSLVEDNLLRIGQEALTNAVKHAHASWLKIELIADASKVHLSIEDDGRGFDEIETRPGHFGMEGMRERAARIGGRLTVISRAGAGCSVQVEAPLSVPDLHPSSHIHEISSHDQNSSC